VNDIGYGNFTLLETKFLNDVLALIEETTSNLLWGSTTR